jgi:hypothetical protein
MVKFPTVQVMHINKIVNLILAPNQALHYPEKNPKGFRLPSERNMTFDDVTIRTKDNFNLRG